MITRKFLHIHIPKTGGQQTRVLISRSGVPVLDPATNRNVEECYDIMGKVAPDLDPASVPIFCFVRNPWDWYVSRYFFRNQRKHYPGEVNIPADYCGEGVRGFRKHMRLLKRHWESGEPLMNELGKPAGTDYDPLTLSGWHKMRLKGAKGEIRIGRFENFSEDLIRIFQPLSGMDREAILEILGKRVNSSRHADYREHYDDELRDLVAEWDAGYIKEFGYVF